MFGQVHITYSVNKHSRNKPQFKLLNEELRMRFATTEEIELRLKQHISSVKGK